MPMMVIHWFLFVLAITGTDELNNLRESRDISASDRTMKTIFESCFENHIPSNPVVIFGDFNGISDKVSVIRIDNFPDGKPYAEYQSSFFKPSIVVLMEDSPVVLILNLQLLKNTRSWDHMALFFIIGKNTTSCENYKNVLFTMWELEILNSIYICAQSMNNTSALYTLNPISDYAPHPWKRIEEMIDLYIFRQNFDANISCRDLTYDKTKFLNGFPISAITFGAQDEDWEIGKNYFEMLADHSYVTFKIIRSITIALNASGRTEVAKGFNSMIQRYLENTADIMLWPVTLDSYLGKPFLFPHERAEMIAVVKLKADVSTLQKIRGLWSNLVLVLSAVVLSILFLILIIMNRNFGSALLDITRLLIYSSIRTDTRYSSFRIYFTTMLIFMIISNGVFQGKIAAFLTTREKGKAVKSINELRELGYKMFAPFNTASFAKRNCPKCEFEEVSDEECIDFVLNGTNHVCVINKRRYEEKYILLSLDYAEEILNAEFQGFKCRENWLLHDRVDHMMMRIVESGLPDFWEIKYTVEPKAKRQAMEADWSSAQYRPVTFPKLKFAFQLLAAGLSIATFVLFLELWWTSLCYS